MNATSVEAISWRRLLLAPLLALALGLGQAGAVQAEVVENLRIPLSGEITNPCTGTTDFVEGFAHTQLRITDNPTGVDHYGVHITGVFRGDVLSSVEMQNESLSVDLSDLVPFVGTLDVSIRINERGTATNAYQKLLVHATVTPNGDETSVWIKFGDAECRG